MTRTIITTYLLLEMLRPGDVPLPGPIPIPVHTMEYAMGLPYVSAPLVLTNHSPQPVASLVVSTASSDLPEGWVRKISRTFQREFFECPATGEKSWTIPVTTKPKEDGKATSNTRNSTVGQKNLSTVEKGSSDTGPTTSSKEAKIEASKPKETKNGNLDGAEFFKSQNTSLVQKLAALEKENEALKKKAATLEDDLKRSCAKCDILQMEKDSLNEKLNSVMFEMEQEKHAMLAQVEAQQESITCLHQELKHIATDVAVISPAIQHLATIRDEHKPPAFPHDGSPQNEKSNVLLVPDSSKISDLC